MLRFAVWGGLLSPAASMEPSMPHAPSSAARTATVQPRRSHGATGLVGSSLKKIEPAGTGLKKIVDIQKFRKISKNLDKF